MSVLLRELVGREVSVWPTSSRYTGVLKAVSGGWLQIEAASSERYLIPLRAVRLTKCPRDGITVRATAGGLPAEMVGHIIRVESSVGDTLYSDTGVAEAFDEDWLRVKVNESVLYYGVGNITLVQTL